ncbi:unnamed protein product [Ilex paraguariensis]|uniref:Brix domain-containing protein n=1 Tax=Ilex paraguariensis TaxID=185542 RepID=A0ABC8RIG8_9AQUA
MAVKRKKSNTGDMIVPCGKEDSNSTEKKSNGKEHLLPSMIKNKEKRSAVHAQLKHQKKLEKRKKAKAREADEKRALEIGEEPPPRKIPRTIENTREFDETICKPDDEELFAGNDGDEFSSILKHESTSKILITTCRFNSTRGPAFISELLSVIPNAHYYKRGTYDLKKIVEYATNKDFTSIIVVHTNRREPDALLVIGLPDGPTAHFKLSKLVLRKDIKVCCCISFIFFQNTNFLHSNSKASYCAHKISPKNHGNPTSHQPELVLTNFTTRLGHRIGRLLSFSSFNVEATIVLYWLWNSTWKDRIRNILSAANTIMLYWLIQSLFPQDPNFRGRQVVTFHNQRDFIFFRHHRYIFESKESKQSDSKATKGKDTKDEKSAQEKTVARLQECGPRFTLKLISLQQGTFDTKGGEYEWVHKPEMDTSRRRFFL